MYVCCKWVVVLVLSVVVFRAVLVVGCMAANASRLLQYLLAVRHGDVAAAAVLYRHGSCNVSQRCERFSQVVCVVSGQVVTKHEERSIQCKQQVMY